MPTALDELLAKFNAIVDQCGRTPERKASLKVIFQQLFPAPFGGHTDRDEIFRNMRICSSAHFTKYFRGTVDVKNQFAARWAKLVDISNDRAGVVALIEEGIRENRLDEILMQLWSGRKDIPLASMAAMTTGLFDVGDKFTGSVIPEDQLSEFERQLKSLLATGIALKKEGKPYEHVQLRDMAL